MKKHKVEIIVCPDREKTDVVKYVGEILQAVVLRELEKSGHIGNPDYVRCTEKIKNGIKS